LNLQNHWQIRVSADQAVEVSCWKVLFGAWHEN
jgi:hypothetical protein